jgi:hypothetical protein
MTQNADTIEAARPNPHAMARGASYPLAFQHPTYLVRRSFWSFLGRVTRVFAPDGSLACYIKQSAFKLRQEMTLFADEGQQQPLILMKARQIIGFNIHHDISDPATGTRLGSVRNRGIGFFRDEWELLDANEQPVGHMREVGSALLRRIFPILKNGKWDVEIGGQTCATVRELWRLFSKEYTLDLSKNDGRMDPRFAMACAVLALNRESAREQSR